MKYSFLLVLILMGQLVYSKESKSFIQRIQFISVEKASQLLSEDDAYTSNVSQFDLDSRVQKKGSTKAEQLKQMQL